MQHLIFQVIRGLTCLGILGLISACSDTPNNVTMTLNQGVCVQLDQYSSSAQSSLATNSPDYYTLVINNPSASVATPYCMGVTVQNNNTGDNANNIQVTNNGFQVGFTPIGSTSATYITLYDPAAANVTIGNESQQVNNIVLFDPQNCVTTTGANVTTLMTSGGLCTFYLEILNESSPIGVYPYSLTYNYTNGNANYSVGSTMNQRVYLYGGGNNGLNYVATDAISSAGGTTTATWQTGLTSAPLTFVQYVIEGAYGFVYYAAGTSVFRYNGVSNVQIGNSFQYNINALAFDSSGNIYAAVDHNGLWVYDISSSNPQWVQMTDSNGFIGNNINIISLSGVEFSGAPNILYEITESAAYYCNNPNASNASESCALASGGAVPYTFFATASDVDDYGNLYAGNVNILNNVSISQYTNLWSAQFFTAPNITYTGNIGPTINDVKWSNATGVATLYFGVGNESTESSTYQCSQVSCTPLLSDSGSGNSTAGIINSVATDGMGNVYVGGQNVFSPDWVNTTGAVPGGFVLFGVSADSPSSGSWTPILQNMGQPAIINYIAVASMLTSY